MPHPLVVKMMNDILFQPAKLIANGVSVSCIVTRIDDTSSRDPDTGDWGLASATIEVMTFGRPVRVSLSDIRDYMLRQESRGK